jgi:ATP-dependent protease ClpP protease subunit
MSFLHPTRFSYPIPIQGQATDIQIQAEEILKLKRLINDLYVFHTGQTRDVIGECESDMGKGGFESFKPPPLGFKS